MKFIEGFYKTRVRNTLFLQVLYNRKIAQKSKKANFTLKIRRKVQRLTSKYQYLKIYQKKL